VVPPRLFAGEALFSLRKNLRSKYKELVACSATSPDLEQAQVVCSTSYVTRRIRRSGIGPSGFGGKVLQGSVDPESTFIELQVNTCQNRIQM